MKKIVVGIVALLALVFASKVYASTQVGGQSNGYQCDANEPNRWKTTDEHENSVTLPSGYSITKIDVKAGNGCVSVYPNNSASSCYSVVVNGNTATVTKIGTGPSCKDISHLEGTFSQNACTETKSCDNSCRAQSTTIQGDCGSISCAANAPVAQSCPTTCHTNTVYVSNGQCGQTTCAPNAPVAQSCPTQCGYEGGTVSNGECGTTRCAATQSCEIDQCNNINGLQNSVPEGDYQEEGNCYPKTPVCTDPEATNYARLTDKTYSDSEVCTFATSTPTPSPEPTATPTPGLGQQSKTAISDPICTGSNFDAKIQLNLDGNPVKDVKVKFVYDNEAKYATTGTDGWAGVAYGYKDETNVEFYPEQGYPTQLQKVVLSSNCVKPAVLGASTTTGGTISGKVLGASTLAKTGVVEDTIVNLMGVFGAGLSTAGSILYAKKKNR